MCVIKMKTKRNVFILIRFTFYTSFRSTFNVSCVRFVCLLIKMVIVLLICLWFFLLSEVMVVVALGISIPCRCMTSDVYGAWILTFHSHQFIFECNSSNTARNNGNGKLECLQLADDNIFASSLIRSEWE